MFQDKEVQTLQNRVTELERQLAEARAAISILRSSDQDSSQAGICYEQSLRELAQKWEVEKAKLLANEERLQSALFLAPHPLMIRREDGRVVMVNAAWTEITGYTLEDIPTTEAWTQKAYGEQAPQRQSLIRNEGFTLGGIRKWGEFEVTTRSGEKRIWDFSSAPLGVDSKGRRLAMTMAVDITERKQMEKQLQENQQKYSLLFGKSAVPAALVKMPEVVIMDTNEAFERLVGYTREEMYGKTVAELGMSIPEERAQTLERLEKHGSLYADENRIFTKAGEERIVSINVNPLEFGGQHYAISTLQDLTEYRRAEAALQTSEAKYRNLVETAFEGVWAVDINGRTTFINHRMAEILKYDSPDELMGYSAFDFVPPEDLDEVKAKFRERLDRNSPEQYYVRLQCRDGSIIWASVAANNVLDENGNVTGRMALFMDITERRLAEEALRESEQRYRNLFEMMQEGLVVAEIITGEDGKPIDYRYLDVNPATERQFGIPRAAFVGRTYTEVLPEGDREWIDIFGRVALTGEPISLERYGKASKRWFECHVYSPRPGQVVNIVTDITDRKQFEIALRKRESILAQAGEIAHLGAWDIEFHNHEDMNANPLSWSDEVYRIFGYAPGEVKPSNELFFERVHPDDRAMVQESIAQAITTQRPYKIEHRIRRPDGEERIVQEHAEVFFDESDQPLRIVGAVQDITERKRAEEALRESEQRFRSLADSMPQLVWTALPDGTVDYYNSRAQEYWGIKQVMSTVWEWAPVLHPEDLQPTIAAWQHSLATGEIYQIQHRVRMADGSYRWHLSRGVPILDERGWIVRWFGTATDIHDTKLAEEQLKIYTERLERSNRELEQFAFIASHDLQEPLRKVEVFGDLLLESSKSLSGRERNYLDRMRDAAGRMRDMVDGLLQLSRVTTQGKPFVQVNLSQEIADVLYDLETQTRRTGGKVEVGTFPAIDGDPLQLRQLIQNLIGNALKYHQPDTPPEIKIHAKQLEGSVQIIVEDNGIGFEQADTERIFKPFQRLVGRSQYEGSGMGLAICRRIVERHGGEITARSQPGQGSTFIVTLPIYQDNSSRKDASNDEPATPPGR